MARPRRCKLELTAAERRGGPIVALDGAVLTRGDAFALGPLDLAVGYGDRILLRGPNGAGKSTMLAALEGTLAPAARHPDGRTHRRDRAARPGS